MSFVNIFFYPLAIGLFLSVLAVQWIFRSRSGLSNKISKLLLLLFSYLVMGLYDWRFCICISAVILITYFAAVRIEKCLKTKEYGKKKVLTILSIVILVMILGVFKYLNFFMSTAMTLAGHSWTALRLILPLGISFYIFSAIGYILDVSWEKISADKNLLDVALFLSFFPKQVCGPIVNGRDFLPQLNEERRITLKNLEAGIQIYVFGMYKKMVIADHLAVFVDDVFYAPAAYGTFTIWLAVFSYYLQLYFDFSGYSDMAIGISKVFGYDITPNFNLPFTARNISEFWDRWHISLSSWLNEYVFNPVAMRLKRIFAGLPSEKRKAYKRYPNYIAILVTFLVSGLWHGAGFTFLVWGLCHGVWSVIHAGYAERMKKCHKGQKKKGRGRDTLDILATYFLVNLVQVFFRAESLKQAFYIFGRMFTIHEGIEQPYTWTFFAYIVLIVATLVAYRKQKKLKLKEVTGSYPIMDLNTVRGLTIFFVLCGLTIIMAYFGETYFVYGNF